MPNRKNPSSTLTKDRRRAFLFFTIVFPLIFLLLAEGILRILDYGPDISLFRYQEVGGKVFHNMNPEVKARYFSRVEFNPMTSLDFFPVSKRSGTFRIFCLGASTTAGYPYGYNGSFPTFLKQRLSLTFPDRSFEIVNLGLTATNSFTALDFTRELMDYEPDLVIVYGGHNEFYGALGVASNESISSGRWLTQAYLRLVHFKVFLLLREGYSLLLAMTADPGDPPSGGTMMERLSRGRLVEYRGGVYQAGLSTFRENVSDMIDVCRSHRVPVIISSQASNLRHLRPFVSANWDSLTVDDLTVFRRFYNAGLNALAENDPDSALVYLTEAAAIDTVHAGLHYYRGRSLDATGGKREAFSAYSRARDYDQLRFRQSREFNTAAQEIASSGGAIFADIEGALCKASPDSIIGYELMLEHVHPNEQGYFLMGKTYANVMRENNLVAAKEDWRVLGSTDESLLWNGRLTTELDRRAAKMRTALLTASWPFRSEPTLLPRPDPEDRIAAIAQEMLNGDLSWEQAHVAAAEYYEARGELELVEKEYGALIAMTPFSVSPYLRLGRVLLKQLKYESARDILTASLDVEPTVYAYRALGAISVDLGRPREAIPFLDRAVLLSVTRDERVESNYLLALAYGRANDTRQAVEQLRKVLDIDPSHQQAGRLLQRLTGGN